MHENNNHKIYKSLLDKCPLTDQHKKHLNNRGITNTEAIAFGYGTLPMRRKNVIDEMAKEHGADLKGVPGFWRDEFGNWKLAGSTGLMVPIRDCEGNITGIKIRADKPMNPQAKYTQLSSNPKPNSKTGEVKYLNGAAATLSVHWPLMQSKMSLGDVLRITEGEIKADIATMVTGVRTLSLPGVGLWKLSLPIIEKHKPEKILLAFDSDKEDTRATYKNPDGKIVEVGKALAALYSSLKKSHPGTEVKIETWSGEFGKGIDDVLVNGGEDKIWEMDEKEAETFIDKAGRGDLPVGFAYIMGTKRFVDPRKNIEMDTEQFNCFYMHECDKGMPAALALKNPSFPKFHYPIYMPDGHPVFEKEGKTYLNVWKRNELEMKDGPVDKFIEHIEYMLPNDFERGILLDWLAWQIQNPGKKVHWALLLQGTQGTGKSYLGWIMKNILGENNVSFPSNEVIHEIYTGWAKACSLIVIEELMARGRLDLMNKLKPMITQDSVMIREMHRPAYEQPNVFNMLMFTNHEDAIIIDRTDRRYCVLFSPAQPKEGKYYKELWAWSEQNLSSIMGYLFRRDLSEFEAKGHAPMTAGKQMLIRNSMTPVEAWVREGIESEAWPFQMEVISPAHLLDVAPTSIRGASVKAISSALKEAGAIQLGQVKVEGVGRLRMWALRRAEMWKGAQPETISAEYLKWSDTLGEPGTNPIKESKPM